ncbi:uncharacterized protein LOC100740289 isoform X4 [Bombus impatiens]|uniref:Uncharacterized protein LOC100740289 isoform X4 n=1 Tax=Bombus impatiens TaxID=132113 RepID=A0A6P8LRY5_BOMIM|nr:uncharacterized protein LOC100740289 isoform X4 [Bombus impatiens]
MCSSHVLNRRSSNRTSSSYSWYTFTAKATYKRRKAVVTGEYACGVHDLTMAIFDNNSSSIIGKCVLLMFLIIVQVTGQEDCNEANCPGQLIVRHYKGIGCTPIYANPNDCCAEAYDCSHLDNLSRDKCYVNGHEYSVGEMLNPEDTNPCDRNCMCTQFENTAFFQCEQLRSCFGIEERCSYRRIHGLCCGFPFCNEEGDNTTCNVNGKVYKAGEFFYPNANPKLLCLCMEGYTASPNDTVISKHDSTTSVPAEGKVMCRHGNLTLHIGEELSNVQPIEVWSAGMKCVCEVPPYLTCYTTTASSEED